MSDGLSPHLSRLLAAGTPAVLVTVAEAKGSTPRARDAKSVVTGERGHRAGRRSRKKWECLAQARKLLAGGRMEAWADIPLGPRVGQCCGGRVRIRLRRAGPAELTEIEAVEAAASALLPTVLLFGAGHVGRALAAALAPLPLRLRWIDARAGEFPHPAPPGVEVVVTERPLAEIDRAAPGSAAFVLTHSHALDFTLCSAVLERGDFAYLGLIGSATKRAKFERGFRELGIARERIARLVCPIGSETVRDKRPAVIAALVAAELVTCFSRRTSEAPRPTLVAG